MDYNNLPKSFCILPWIHSAINPDGSVRPCCVSKPWSYTVGNLNKNSLKEIFNDQPMRELRKQLLTADRLPDSCRSCRLREGADTTVPSLRQEKNKTYRDVIEALEPNPDGSAEFQQLYIDYRFSNKCNFKCISCGPSLSSSIAQEKFKIEKLARPEGARHYSNVFIEVDADKFYKEFVEFSSTIREIYFAGGEPLINDHHYELLEHLVNTQQPVKIFYNTNFSELNYKGKNVIDLWRRANGPVGVFASVDGYGLVGETIREGFETAKFKDNVRKYIASGLGEQQQIGFSITFGLTNYDHVIDTTRWLAIQVHEIMTEIDAYNNPAYAHGRYYPMINFNPIIVPEPMSITFVSSEQRDRIVATIQRQLQQLIQDTEFMAIPGSGRRIKDIRDTYLSYVQNVELLSNPDMIQLDHQIQMLDEQEQIRKTDWRTTLSSMHAIWTEIIENKGKK